MTGYLWLFNLIFLWNLVQSFKSILGERVPNICQKKKYFWNRGWGKFSRKMPAIAVILLPKLDVQYTLGWWCWCVLIFMGQGTFWSHKIFFRFFSITKAMPQILTTKSDQIDLCEEIKISFLLGGTRSFEEGQIMAQTLRKVRPLCMRSENKNWGIFIVQKQRKLDQFELSFSPPCCKKCNICWTSEKEKITSESYEFCFWKWFSHCAFVMEN